jgi:hypothetical protein
MQTGRLFTEHIALNFSVKAYIDIAQQKCIFQIRFTEKFTTKSSVTHLPVCKQFLKYEIAQNF